jgi:hypothetical protein
LESPRQKLLGVKKKISKKAFCKDENLNIVLFAIDEATMKRLKMRSKI